MVTSINFFIKPVFKGLWVSDDRTEQFLIREQGGANREASR